MEEVLGQALEVIKNEVAVHNGKEDNLNHIDRNKQIESETLQLIKGVKDSFSPVELGKFVKELLAEAEKIKTIETFKLEDIPSGTCYSS
ncbi:hypothetical protein CIL03_17095 [Virgibacillus indicus]|uniref:Uncharacterized protein n=1 Tax=Virgibacillus indicus TaxID=2024554 RepID=A0A265N5K5_9BACI|nr:hypothetical protein [Virgibacillus indicus]OZU87313.1 hypothetical protein CIL03_17095 [Virgibacillus indicus]